MKRRIFAAFLAVFSLSARAGNFEWQPFEWTDQKLALFPEEKTLDGKSKFRVFTPSNTCTKPERGWPIVLFLHGSGESGWDDKRQITDSGSFAEMIASHPEHFCAFGVFPQNPGFFFDPTLTWNLPLALSTLNATIARHEIDRDRTYVMGLSMGAIATCSLLRSNAGFAAGVSFSGCLSDHAALPPLDTVCRELRAHPMPPLWMFHGAEDQKGLLNQGVDPASSTEMWDALKCSDTVGRDRFTFIPGIGHSSWGCFSPSDLTGAPAPLGLCSKYEDASGMHSDANPFAAYDWLMSN